MKINYLIPIRLVGILAASSLLLGCEKISEYRSVSRGKDEITKITGYTCDTANWAIEQGSGPLKLDVGLPYSEARKLALKEGWAPIPFEKIFKGGCDDGAQTKIIREQFPEVKSCAGTGVAPCVFEFVRNGELLVIETTGEDPKHNANHYASAENIFAVPAKKEAFAQQERETAEKNAKAAGFADVKEMQLAAYQNITDGKQWREFLAAEQERIADANRTPLERALDPFTGTHAKYRAWADEGGLNHPNYKLAESYRTFYGEQLSELATKYGGEPNRIRYIEAKVLGSSPRLTREALAKACRVATTDFQRHWAGDEEAKNGDLACIMGKDGDKIVVLRGNGL